MSRLERDQRSANRRRKDRERDERLAQIAQQVADGSLTIRWVTPEQLERWRLELAERADAPASSTLSDTRGQAGARQLAADATGTDSSPLR
jgi:L-lactate utilization protein LutC